MRKKLVRVTSGMAVNEAKKLAEARILLDEEEINLKARFSRNWLTKFLRRHNFSFRKPTSVSQKPPDTRKFVDFVLYLCKERKKNYAKISACDETAVWLNRSGNIIDERGAHHVTVKSFGSEKLRITVLLSACADGHKLKPFDLLPNRRKVASIQEKFGNDLDLIWCGKSWMDNDPPATYLRMNFRRGPFSTEKRLLIWDAFRCHISVDTKKELRKLEIETAVVPGGCTKYVQQKIADLYNEWALRGAHELTKGGNPKPPPMAVYLVWLLKAWNSISTETIVKSFKVCGITTALDGSEDDQIACFRQNGEVQEGLEMLTHQRFIIVIDDMNLEGDSFRAGRNQRIPGRGNTRSAGRWTNHR